MSKAALAEIVHDWAGKPFRYGQDCCQFAGAVVEAVTGANPMNTLHYEGEQGAHDLIARFGSLRAAVTAVLGEPVPLTDTKTGDVVLIEMKGGDELVGVVINGRAVVRDKSGVRDLNLGVASLAWSV
jgi:hypothetical protein